MDENRNTIPFVRRRDWIALAVIVALAAVLWVTVRGGSHGAMARVEFGTGMPSMEISLAGDGLYDIEGGRLPVQLEVSDGRIRFINSVCPDHTCERHGWLQHEGEQAICMPAAVAVTVVE